MAIVPIEGRVRPGRGKGPARQARREGLIPAVMYGHGEEPLALAIPQRAFELAMKAAGGGNVIIGLKLGGADQTAIIREVQRDPVSHNIIHLDFQHISLTEKVKVEVTLHLTGTPDGVKSGGGVLEMITRTVEIECLPTDLPQSVDVDVTRLNIGDSIHVSDLAIPNVTILSDPGLTIATVVPPTKQVEVTGGEPAAPAEPEVIAKGKTEEAAEKKD